MIKKVLSAVPDSLLRLLNILFSCCVIAPLVISYWASTWKICEFFIWPSDPKISVLISLAIGSSVQFLFMFYQDSIENLLTFKKYKILNLISAKVYALVFAQSCVNFWRGVWSIVDKLSSDDIAPTALNVVQNLLILIMSRTLRNVIGAPFVVLTDQAESCFRIPTIFNLKKSDGQFKFLIDCVCSLMIVLLLTFVWRDVWTITSLMLFPENVMKSAYSSVAIGFSLSLTCFVLEASVTRLCKQFPKVQIVIKDVFMIVCLLATVNVWRGVWMLLEILSGGKKEVILLLNGIIWKVLMVLNCTNSLAGGGIVRDGEGPFQLQIQFFNKETELEPKDKKKTEDFVTKL